EHRNYINAITRHVWRLLLNLSCNHFQVGLSLRPRYARFETSDYGEPERAARAAHPLVRRQRLPQISFFRKLESGRHYSYDHVRFTAERDRLVQNIRITTEMPLPKAVAQNGYPIPARLFFFCRKTSPAHGVHS